MDKMLITLGNNSANLTGTVSELKTSLEFSQSEIVLLKDENRVLRQKLADMELKGSQSTFQLKKVEEKKDRVETICKRKKVVFEGIPEMEDERENVDKTVWALFNQIKVGKGIDLDTSYRQGYFSRSRCRPVVISFQKQTDRD